jgi:hypothetical protein
MAPRLTLLTAILFLLAASPANATQTVEITSGGVGGSTFDADDFAGILRGAGLAIGGRITPFPFIAIFNALPTGHYIAVLNESIFVNGVPVPDFTGTITLDFTFTPITVGNLGPFVGAGQTEIQPMTMVGVFNAAGFETINLFGHGIADAGWAARDSLFFGTFNASFGFVPEPSSIALVVSSIVALLVLRRVKI